MSAKNLKLLSNKHQFEYAGACRRMDRLSGYPFARGRIFDICEEDQGQYNHERTCFLGKWCGLVCRAECIS